MKNSNELYKHTGNTYSSSEKLIRTKIYSSFLKSVVHFKVIDKIGLNGISTLHF